MPTNAIRTAAALLVTLEGLALAALAVWQVVAIAMGDTAAIDSALALLVLTAIGAIVVIAFGVAVFRGRSWGRSGGIVTQVLVLAVALGAATGAYAHPLIGVEIAIPAVVTLVLLVLAARDAARAASTRPKE